MMGYKPCSSWARNSWAFRLVAPGLIAVATPAAGQVEPPLDGRAALALDAATYAASSGLSPAQAQRELEIQEASVPVTDALKVEFASRLAGLSVGHAPFHIDILLTGDAPVADRTVAIAGANVLIRFRTGAYASHDQLIMAAALYQTEIRASLTKPPGIGVDPRIGALVVMVGQADVLAEPGDALRDRIARLTFLGQWGWGYQDVQLQGSAVPLAPTFWSDTAKTVRRRVEGQRARGSTRAGDIVCHRGERTGYSCAEVWLPDFAPAGDLCGGGCTPTWVAVRGPTCRSGDSGGPVFLGGTAFGIVKGGSYRADGSCAFYYYMSLDFLPSGWSLALG